MEQELNPNQGQDLAGRNKEDEAALLKAEEKIKNLAFKDEPATPDFQENLQNRILAARHRHFSMSEFLNKLAKGLIFMFDTKAFVPAVAVFLIIAVGLSLTMPWLPRQAGVNNPWGKISQLVINPAYAQDNFSAEATISDSLGVGADTAFIIKSKEAIDEQTLRANITLQPTTEFSLTKIDDHTYQVIPAQALAAKKVYSLKIASAYVDQSGATVERDYSWAFQVKDIFKVLNSIPGNQANGVPLDAGIEVTFSNENFSNYEQAFKIEPAIAGRFEIHKRTLVFVPKALEAGMIYTVTINKDLLKVTGSEAKLAENYVIQFETDPAGKKRGEYSEFNFQNNFNEIYTERAPALAVNLYNIKQETFAVEVYAFSGADGFIAALEKSQKIPYWAQYNRAVYNTDVSALTKVSSFSIPLSPFGYNKYLVFPDKIAKGFYVVQVNINGVYLQTFMEVSDLTNYTTVTDTNTLVWLNNIKTKGPAAGAKVKIIGTDKQTVTGSDGTAVMPTSWLSAGTTSDRTYLLIDAGEKTIVPINFNYQNTAPTGVMPLSAASKFWYYFYTDRMTYQPGDTVSYWGFVKPREGVKSSSTVTIKLFGWQSYYDYYNDPVPLLQTAAQLDPNFTFTGKIDLGRLSAGYYYLEYFIGDQMIGSRGLNIENYVKPAYKVEANADQHAVFAGQTQSIAVKASFFEGTPVPNLALTDPNDNGQLKTNALGEAIKTFKVDPVSGDYGSNCNYFYPVASEEADISASACYTVFNYSVVPKGELVKTDGADQAKLQLNVKKVDIAKANVVGATEDQFLHEAAPGMPVTVSVTEISYQAVSTGQYYDFFNKIVRNTYRYNEIRNNIASAKGKTDSAGQYQYSFPIKPKNSYEVNVTIKDVNGQDINERYYIYYSQYNFDDQSDYYNLGFKDQKKTDFSLGEQVQIQYKNKDQLLPVAPGHYLFYRLFKGLVDYQIGGSAEYNFNFTDRFLPGVYVMGVYFDGETYHRPGSYGYWESYSPGLYVPFKQTDRELKVEVTPDKDKYQPGGEVKLAVKVTDKSGKPVAASVNLNLVDESYYAIYPENVDALGGLYGNRVEDGELVTYISNPAPALGAEVAERGGCFLAGTKITMADRSLKNIEDVKIGDEVLTFTNETARSLVAGKVTKTYVHEVGEYLIINDKLKITPIHRVFLNGQWRMIGEAKVGDWLLDEQGEKVKIAKIEDRRGLFKVYNLTIEPYHTFFAEGFYVHNDKGGGVRSLFVDTAVFMNVNTGADGAAIAAFKLPDNITSWRVTAQALSGDLYAGDKVINLKSSLPAFVNTTFAKEYLTVDKPIVKVRAFGDALRDNDPVQFKMDAPTLNFSSTTVGQAFVASYFKLPPLAIGEHSITTAIKAGGNQDAVLEKVKVLDTRFKETKTQFYELSPGLKAAGAPDGQTNLIFSDKNQGRFYGQLSYCFFCSGGDRVDQKLARVVSADLLKKYFGEEPFNPETFNGAMYQTDDGGVALLPYASSDFELSAKVAFVAGDYFDKTRLTNYFYKILTADDSTREQVGVSLFALSGLGEPILSPAENFAALPDLTAKEKLYIGIALNHLGDAETARAIYSAVIKDKGEKLDPYLRVKVSDSNDEILAATSLAAILAGGLLIPDHEQLWNYAESNYTRNISIDLEKLAYVSETLPKLTPGEVSFTINLPGRKIDKTLSRGESFRLKIEPADLGVISFSNIKGQVGLTSSYQAREANIAPRDDSYVSLRREYYVNGVKTNTFKESDLVEIRMYPSFKPGALNYGYQITDLLPSGLSVMTNLYSRGMNYSCSNYYPYEVNGQTVKFSIWKDWNKGSYCHTDYFSYFARVVNPGEYRAESAVIQSFEASTVKNYSGANTVLIEK
ncbi:MAG: polymorphic toxin-type HINT domain-containing protein [Patescibacteria group bacterium]|nr:polymorphic toxin-type HINT domain-containing protein [Patescibacteria group bacterium]